MASFRINPCDTSANSAEAKLKRVAQRGWKACSNSEEIRVRI
jgi:hypothetical protein